MSCEIELKLRLLPAQVRRLTAHPALFGFKAEKSRLFNTYYDTPDLDLQRRGIALRLRRKGWSVWLMTVKGGESGAGGLSQRREWEAPTQPGVFDFSIVGDPELRTFLEERKSCLLPVFTTDFTRTAWSMHRSGAVIELALDRGKISASTLFGVQTAVSENLCELELELIEGTSTDSLFELAVELAGEFHLHPEIVSKAERGYSLATGVSPRPTKGFSVVIGRDISPVDAFRSVASACLIQLQRNEPGAITGENPEYIHQARVAIRRLRSALKLFSPALSADFISVYSPRWQTLARNLGGARDWDVFLAETLTPLENAFPDNPDLAGLRARALESRAAASGNAARSLTQQAYSQLLLAFSAALFRETVPTIAAPSGKWGEAGVRRFAARRLHKRWESIDSLVRAHGRMRVERCHELRIEFKKLRYALEFFAPIFPRKRLEVYLSAVESIQELLGTVNDQATALQLVRNLHPERAPDSLVDGWIAGRSQLLLAALGKELKRFLSCKKPW